MEKDEPRRESRMGTTRRARLRGDISIGCVVQAAAAIEPCSGPALACAFENTTRAKSASGSGVQSSVKHVAGASAIHSAESRSSDDAITSVANDAPVDRFRNSRSTVLPRRLRRADTRSPGLMTTGMSTGGDGTSWYQAEYHGE